MPQWATFAVFAGVVLVGLLLLARASQSSLEESALDGSRADDSRVDEGGADRVAESPPEGDSADASPAPATDADRPEAGHATDRQFDDRTDVGSSGDRADVGVVDDRPTDRTFDAGTDQPEGSVAAVGSDGFVAPVADEHSGATSLADLPATALLANVAISHGLFAALLLAGAWFTGVPASTLGVSGATLGLSEVLLGVAFGVALYVANEVGATVGRQYGLGGSEALREALAPESGRGWVLLLFGVLPIIAGFEELLFRGVLVGAFGVALGVSPWLLAAVSSVLFALGHGAQGPTGIVVTGVLGFVLAAGFVLTGSLLLVVVAHYVVNALEFVVHELVGVSWSDGG